MCSEVHIEQVWAKLGEIAKEMSAKMKRNFLIASANIYDKIKTSKLN
jgi:hypothetical protein